MNAEMFSLPKYAAILNPVLGTSELPVGILCLGILLPEAKY